MKPPVRVGIANLTHDHVFSLARRLPPSPEGEPGLPRARMDAIEIVGVFEPDLALARKYAPLIGFPGEAVYDDLGAMLDAARPEAVTAYGSIFDHLAVVEACAPRGIHVMVEKPLAVSAAHAQRMAALARQHGITLITNYETTWYASNHAAYRMVVQEGLVGEIRKVVVHDGHFGPQEIGCSPEFLAWLTDPLLNGGGAIIDFGCYGANLVTWLMGGQAPISVSALAKTLKPEIYPRVDDDATILLEYPRMTAVVQGSWNWPVSRKDIEIYGQHGQVIAPDGRTLRIRLGDRVPEETVVLEANPAPLDGPFSYLAAVVRGEITVQPGDLSSLENNLVVVQILDAARESTRTGKRVELGTLPGAAA